MFFSILFFIFAPKDDNNAIIGINDNIMGIPRFLGRILKSTKSTYPSVIDPSKVRTFVRTTETISPQQAAATFHLTDFSTMPLSKPISIAEKVGIPKGDRGLFNWDQVPDLIPRFNKWAQYYGYGTIPESTSMQDSVNIMKNTFKRHNTFFRGLTVPYGKDANELERVLGKNFKEDQAYAHMATTPREGDSAVFASPVGNALIYGGNGKTAIIRRNYSLGKEPEKWLKDADFDIRYGNGTFGTEIQFPWSQRGTGNIENEVLIPKGQSHFVGYVPDSFNGEALDFVESNGSLNKYLGNKSYHSIWGFGPYDVYTDIPIEKPKFKKGGKIKSIF